MLTGDDLGAKAILVPDVDVGLAIVAVLLSVVFGALSLMPGLCPWCRMLTGEDLGAEALSVPDVDKRVLLVLNTPLRCRMLTGGGLGAEYALWVPYVDGGLAIVAVLLSVAFGALSLVPGLCHWCPMLTGGWVRC